MTATESTGASASMDSLIDTSLDSAATESTGAESTESTETAEAQPTAEQATAEPTEPVVAEAAKAEPEDEFTEDELKPDKVSPDGKTHYYTAARAAKLMASHQAWREVQAAIPGATVDAVKDMYATSAGIEQMQADYHAGNVTPFVDFWKTENPDSFVKMMLDAQTHLASVDTKFARQMERQADMNLVERLYNTFGSTRDGKWLALAQHLDQAINSRFKAESEIGKHNPEAEERARFEAERKAFAAEKSTMATQRLQSWMKETDTAVKSTTEGLISKALSIPELKVFEGQRQMNWMKTDLEQAVANAIGSNPTWRNQHEALRKQAEARPSEQTRSNLVAHQEGFVKQVIARERKAIIEAATGRTMSQSAAAHSKQAAAATRTEPSNSGSPVNGVSVNPRLKNAKSMEELIEMAMGR